MKRIFATFVASIALLALPSAALAGGSSATAGYNPQLNSVKNGSAPHNNTSPGSTASTPASPSTAVSPTATTAKANASTLPFTGLDLGLLAAGGVVLLGAGLVVRRLSGSST